MGEGGHGGCERRIEAIVKMKKVGGWGVGGEGGFEHEELNHCDNAKKFKGVGMRTLLQNISEQIKPEDQWSCKRSPDILAY